MSPVPVKHLILAVALALPAAAQAQDPLGAARGMRLYENHCTVCHESVVHVREHRKAKSLEDIGRWVRRWADYLALGWNQEEIDDVSAYLNGTFYGY